MRARTVVLAVALLAVPAAFLCAGWFDREPLTDMRGLRYKTFPGGLYPGGNVMPADHATAGAAHAAAVVPRDPAGAPSPGGRYVLLSIGMSNTTQEFCSGGGGLPCDPFTFMGQAAADPAVNHTTLAIANGALGGRSAAFWDSPLDPDYDRVRDTVLAPRGLTEAQVQIVWVKVANPGPTIALPSPASDGYRLLTQQGDIVRALKVRYPNLQQVFLSSRTYGGYATTVLNPEPYAYESGFAVKWLVEAQIEQMRTGVVDPRAGDLDYGTVAPWLAWGPYLWARGMEPRSDGLVWLRSDFSADGTHPSNSGRQKVGTLLLNFFKASPPARCWFLAGQTCPLPADRGWGW
ncbi:MAG TPA: hypothetical protein VFO85_22830 [Vicinamibacteria bacterium]|nr:hypothetical protein [Vicinamibacteria bacterium]